MPGKILYQEVAGAIKKNILTEKYPLGSLIPTENALMAAYNVSKITIRKAVELLVDAGFLAKRQGVGTRVISNNLFNKLSKADSFTTILNTEGKKVTKKLLAIEAVDPQALPAAIGRPAHRVTKIQRLYQLDGKPYIYFTHFLPFTDQVAVFRQLDRKPLYRLLKEQGVSVSYFHDSFVAVALTPEQQKLLATNQKLAIQRQRRSYNAQDELIEYSEGIYVTALNPYEIRYEI